MQTLEDKLSTSLHVQKETEQHIFIRPSINALQGKAFKHVHRTLDKELLEDLSRENYRAKFHQLLCQEEEEHDRVLSKRL